MRRTYTYFTHLAWKEPEPPPPACLVCGRAVPLGTGVYHGDLGITTHLGPCDGRVDGERRVHDRSRRGRWRPRAEILARLRLRRIG